MNLINLQNCRELITNYAHQNFISNEMNPMLNSLQSNNASELAKEISQYINNNSINHKYSISGSTIANIARDFHMLAGTLTPSVESNIKKIDKNEYILLIPHQPNLFPSLSIITPFILIEKVANILSTKYNISTALIYLIIDYDCADDKRFRTSKFPDIFRREEVLLLNNGIPKSKCNIPMWLLEKPPNSVVNKWIADIYQTIRHTLAFIKSSNILNKTDFNQHYNFILKNFHLIESIIWESYESSRSLTEFNTIFLSKLINNHWGQEICFIPGHLLHSNNSKAYKWAIPKSNEIKELEKEASSVIIKNGYKISSAVRDEKDTLLWYICDKCNKRLTLNKGSNNTIFTEHVCSFTLKNETISIPINQLSLCSHRIYPKVTLDNILDIIALGKVGGSGYIGQTEHLMISNYISTKLGLSPPPQIILNSKGLYYGLIELSTLIDQDNFKKSRKNHMAFFNSYFGKASIIYYIIYIGINETKEIWYNFFSETENVHEVNEGSVSFSPFSQSINEKIRNISEGILTEQKNIFKV